jgi:hypothetical protein
MSFMNAFLGLAPIALTALLTLATCEKKNSPLPVAPAAPASAARTDSTPIPPTPPVSVVPAAPDNTAKNKVDTSGDTKAPMDQSESAGDLKITADIRRAITDDKAMSMNAQNCKVITDSRGMVTLRGVVDSQVEKDSIEVKAKQVAGASHVDNQLEVKPN